MSKEIVVAKYDKDVSWISKINNDVKIVVYRKDGINEKILVNTEAYILPNIGREMHSYFYHIYNNYDNLSDFVIFSQDNPFDHIENYIEIINGNVDTWNKHTTLYYEQFWSFHWNSLGTMWSLSNSKQFFGKVLTCPPNSYDLDINKTWNKLFVPPPPEEYEFTPGAHFITTREVIHSRPREFYKSILFLLATEYDSPWILERLTPYIFNNNFKIKK